MENCKSGPAIRKNLKLISIYNLIQVQVYNKITPSNLYTNIFYFLHDT